MFSSPAARLDTFVHCVDAQDVIVLVDDAWCRFARENGLDPLSVGGTRLWDHIADAEVRELTWYLLKRVRDGQCSLTVPFRCDAPDRRRFMEMVWSPEKDLGVRFTSRLLREEPREYLALMGPGRRSAATVHVCSWCKKVQVAEAEWCEAEEAIARLKLFDEPLPRILHRNCPHCVSVLSG